MDIFQGSPTFDNGAPSFVGYTPSINGGASSHGNDILSQGGVGTIGHGVGAPLGCRPFPFWNFLRCQACKKCKE